MMSATNPSIFISRSLEPQSEIRRFLESEKQTADTFSLIDFTSISFQLPESKWLFFYSKSAVRFFFDQLVKDINCKKYKFASFGPSTGKLLELKIHRNLDYHGNTVSQEIAHDLTALVKEQSVCFVVGQNSLRSVQTLLPNTVNQQEVIVYNNQVKTSVNLLHYNIAVLTSPMNAQSFVNSGGSADHYISIGQTTSDALRDLDITSTIATEPSERGIRNTLKRVHKEYYRE